MTLVKFDSGGRWCKVDGVNTKPGSHGYAPQRRGDKQRVAIMQAVRQLLQEKPFAELSVSTISDRAGVARSGFYFYFESKYAVLAQILAEVVHEFEELTRFFAPRDDGESPAEFARRMVGSAAAVYAHHDPVVAACNVARNTDAEIREILDAQLDALIEQIVGVINGEIEAGTAHPISADVLRRRRSLCPVTPPIAAPTATSTAPCGSSKRCGCPRCGAARRRARPVQDRIRIRLRRAGIVTPHGRQARSALPG